MKKIIGIFFCLALCANNAFANSKTPQINVNCDDVKISTNTIGKNNYSFYVYWNEPTTFPNPPISKKVGLASSGGYDAFSFNCPTFSVSFDGNMAEIKAGSYLEALEKINKYDRDIALYHYSFYRYPNIRRDLITVGYSFDLDNLNLKSGVYTANEGDRLDGIAFTHNIPKEAIIGYKVNGESLKPLLYNRTVSKYKEDFANAETIDIYHKLPKDDFNLGANIERIYIDKKNGIIRIYRKSKFPS